VRRKALEREKGEPKITAWTYYFYIRISGLNAVVLTYFALKYAETALEDVHDREVNAFPVVYDFVIVDAGDYEGRWVVLACLFYARLFGFLGVPSLGFSGGLFGLSDES
jgi:hypothetical protein